MEVQPRKVDIYVKPDRAVPFDDWLSALKDQVGRAAIDMRLNWLRRGLLGDYAEVGGGVLELRIDFGPGYRISCVDDAKSVLVLCGGTKRTQVADIARAHKYWKDYQEEVRWNAEKTVFNRPKRKTRRS